ncbi:MAG: MBOAT family protein, partial [Deltaproteobacteria bacterium]|nr:MBOAT family protein [Deltaproteobacteria bacterium]
GVALLVMEWPNRGKQHALESLKSPVAVRWMIYLAISTSIILLGRFGGNQFIYFQF